MLLLPIMFYEKCSYFDKTFFSVPLVLGAINKNLKNYFYLEYILGFLMKKMIEEVNFLDGARKTKKLPKNLKLLKT